MTLYHITIVAALLLGTLHAEPPLEIVTASYFGTGAESDLQGSAAAPDGTIYVVGNSSTAAVELPGSTVPLTLGREADPARCGSAFVAHLSADGRRLLGWTQLARGAALFTTVEVGPEGVYVGGYGGVALEGTLRESVGLIRDFPLTHEIEQHERDVAAGKEDKIAGRPGLGRYGAPCVLRFSPDLATLRSGTYLEGWQQVWDKKRVAKPGREMLGGYQEYFWQPTGLAVLSSGEVAVGHDGGYFRPATDRDRELAKDDPKLLDRLIFYDTCDYVSKLSPDLAQRIWKRAVYTPPVDPEVAQRVKAGWPLPHYSSPRTHRLRLDRRGNLLVCGWSASATSQEPWWSPYVFRLSAATGEALWKAYEYDPMSGGGQRMGGQVADTAAVSLAVDEDGNLLTSLLADGGNTVMEWSPQATLGAGFGAPAKGGGFPVKLVHWWGQIHRVDAKTGAGLSRAKIGPWGWATDLASLPGNGVLAVGRYNWRFEFTPDAWWKESAVENPNAFLRVYSPDLDLVFSTSLPGFVPFEITRAGERRYVLVGRSEGAISSTKDALFPKGANGAGYMIIFDLK